MRFRMAIIAFLIAACSGGVSAQVLMHGRVYGERFPGSGQDMPFSGILCFASLDGPDSEPLQFRTWEMEPSGWYRMSGPAGRYTMLFSTPADYMRPIVLTNIHTRPGDDIYRVVRPGFDYACFSENKWDEKPATAYYQTFVAKGKCVTQVGLKPVYDGVDGVGPGSQTLLVSIHRKGDGTPDKWPQVGPAMPVLAVDCGGPKGYDFSAGWNSGEAPLVPGETYAVCVRPESREGRFQMFWHRDDDRSSDCYRVGDGNTGWQGSDLWMSVATDSDGLVIPYNKRVHKEFGEFAGMSAKWCQTYVAQGKSLASVIVYAAVSGAQPPLSRQRVRVRVRQGGPNGPVVGAERIAVGSGNYTGDASWGVFGAVYAPGELPLTHNGTYAIEVESIENLKTLHGFTNIKGQVSDDRPGFNPYRKFAPDEYPNGTAYLNGTDAKDFDLDMQITEYEHSARDWSHAVDPKNLLVNGDMEPQTGSEPWREFVVGEAAVCGRVADATDGGNRVLRVTGEPADGKPVDGGFVQRVDGLDHLETYRLSGEVRCTWPVDTEKQCMVGYDPTGQTEDPGAPTIVWTTLPNLHGVYAPYRGEPIRPAKDAISVWLRGRASVKPQWPFEADFDDFALNRVLIGAPRGE